MLQRVNIVLVQQQQCTNLFTHVERINPSELLKFFIAAAILLLLLFRCALLWLVLRMNLGHSVLSI